MRPYGRISGYLWQARELARNHVPSTIAERRALMFDR